MGGLHEFGSIEVGEDGTIIARCGAAPSGQGHETVFPALVAETLGVDEQRVRLIGHRRTGSRSAQVAGAMLQHASQLLIDEARERAAGMWKLPVDEVEWSDGAVHNGSAAMDVAELVKATGPLRVEDRPPGNTFGGMNDRNGELFLGDIPLSFPTAAITDIGTVIAATTSPPTTNNSGR
ncbi:molybdopterin cofactor-binding domain-containing protein [Streptomyces sp. LZ34]